MLRRLTSLAAIIGVGAVILVVGIMLFDRPEEVHEAVESAIDLASAAGELLADDATHDDDDDDGDDVAAHGDDDDDDDEAGTRVEVVDGVPVIFLSDEDRERVGIETTPLAGRDHRPEIVATASVVDIQPMLAHRGQCLGAVYEVELARARLAAAEREYDRLRALNQDDGNVAAKRVQEAEAKVQVDRVSLQRAQAALSTLINEARQGWGTVLADWLIGEQKPELSRLVDSEDVLLLVVLPRGETLPANGSDAWVTTLQDGAERRPASFVSNAPYTDPLAQGESYFYRTDASGLRAGMRVEVRVAVADSSTKGVLVPDIIAIAATAGDIAGVVDIPGASGTAAFSVATSNAGSSGNITVSVDTGNLPLSVTICQTNPQTSECMGAPTPTVTTPGMRAIMGTRSPPSHVLPFMPRKPPVEPPYQGPLSEVKMTSVRSSRSSSLSLPRILPIEASNSAITSAYRSSRVSGV